MQSAGLLSPRRCSALAHLVLPALLAVPPDRSAGSRPAAASPAPRGGESWATLGTGLPLPPAPSPASGPTERWPWPLVSGGSLAPPGGAHSTPVCCFQGQSCRNCITMKMQPALPSKRGAASVPTDSFTCLEVESVQYLAGSAELINLFNNDA